MKLDLRDPCVSVSVAQAGIWFAQQLDPDNPIYNTGEYVELHGPIDPALFEVALRQAVDESDALHARFVEEHGAPSQLIDRAAEWPLHRIDLSEVADPEAAAQAWMRADLVQPIDLAQGPLFTQALFKLAADRHFWYQRIHHIATDGFGLALIQRRVADLYTASSNGQPTDQGAFGALAAILGEETAYRASDQMSRDRDYWLEQLADCPEAVSLAGRSTGTAHTFLRQTARLSPAATERLKQLAHQARLSWPDLVIAATAAYLHRMTGADDIVLGLPSMGRLGSVAARIPGMVVNVLPLRIQVRTGMPLSELAQQVTRCVREMRRHQRYRYEDLIRELRLVGEDRRLFGTMLNILPFDSTLNFAGQRATVHNLAAGPVDDLSIAVTDATDGSGLRIIYDANPALYTAANLSDHRHRFLTFLEHIAMLADLAQPIGQIALLTDEERRQLLAVGSGANQRLPATTIPALFEAQVARTPSAPALVDPDARLSYAELNARANQLAWLLRAQGVGPEQVVALCLPRAVDLAVALLAVLKSGAAYLPLDPAYPEDRLAFMLDDAQPICVLTSSALAVRLPLSVPLIGLDVPATIARLAQQPSRDLSDPERVTPLLPDHSAYIIYTSGSTGRPKGVVVTHGSLSNLFFCHRTERFTPARQANGNQPLRIGHTASFTFDASWDPLLWLLDGHELHVVDEETSRDPQALVEYIDRQRIDYLDCTPSFLQQLMTCGLFADERHKPQIVVVGGEATSEALWNKLTAIAGTTSYNLYGPTEYTVDAYLWQAGDSEQPLVGHPIANTQLYVLDAQGELVPAGVAGELWIAGAGLARGYLNRPDLTAARFQPDPFGAPGTRRYRTGDLARWRRDGTLDFLGRADAQVKVRGFRIELGEIESVLRRQPQVAQAVVLVREDRPGDQRLVAYVVAEHGNQEQSPTDSPSPIAMGEGEGERSETGVRASSEGLPQHLRTNLRQQLPEYMVPAAIVVLSELPLTRNGKLDRRALPAPELERSDGRGPRTPREATLCEIMGAVLGVAPVGIDDSFFELGGHSLLAAQFAARVRAALDVELRIGTLFEAPTVAALAERLDEGRDVRPPLRAAVRPDPIPLSFAQRRLWFLNRLEGASPTYNLPLVLRLSGALDRRALDAALGDLIARHESLRTIFPDTRGVPQQVLLDAAVARPALICVETSAAELDTMLRDAARYSFDLTAELPLRVQLFVVDPQTHVLLVLLHHIAGDGASLAPLARDLATAYTARCHGAAPNWPDLPVQYADYALWQSEVLGSESDPDSLIAQQLDFWRDTLQELPDQLDLPTDHPRPSVASYCGDTVAVAIEPELHRRLLMLARESGTTVFMVLQSALAALLTRLGAGTDIPLGALVAGRSDAALHDLIGFFVNTLVLRTDTSNNPSFRDLLRRVRDTDLAAFAHQELPFERLVEAINPARSLARHPLFQVMFVFQNTASAVLDMPGLTASLDPLHIGAAKFDLSLNLDERRSADGTPLGIRGFIEYSTDLFERDTVVAIAARLVRLLAAVVADPEQPIGRIEILTTEEQQCLLETWNPTIEPLPTTTIPALFEAQVVRTPQAIALNDLDARLSYAELNARANQLAWLLRAQGVGPEQVVALCLPRAVDLAVALLAVLKSGAAYLPLDPAYPAERLQFMLDDAQPACVLTSSAVVERLPLSVPLLLLDVPTTIARLAQQPSRDLSDWERVTPLLPDHSAYIIYTSGSTGRPKGVVIPHQNVVRLFSATDHWFHFGAQDVWTLFHSYAFDFSVWEIWGALLYGGRLVVVPYEISRSPVEFRRLLVQEGVTVLNQTPSAFYQLMQADRESAESASALALRYVIFGGEALDLRRLDDWYGRYPETAPLLVNMYGITETTVHVSYLALDRWQIAVKGANSLIGCGIPDLRVYVLDEHGELVPAGVAGELWIAGAGLARGYLNRPDLTAARFQPDPYGAPDTRRYRTGDLARWRRDGTLDFLGRADAQVKVRGFRIELGEIEAVLRRQPQVAQAAVLVREDRPGDQRLVAYVVPKQNLDPRTQNLDPRTQNLTLEIEQRTKNKEQTDTDLPPSPTATEVEAHRGSGQGKAHSARGEGQFLLQGEGLPHRLLTNLRQQLPEYMVPAAIVVLAELPLTRNGKLDRTALPAPELERSAGRGPRTPREAILCEIMGAVLGVAPVGIDESFFELGGHSLLAAHLVAQVRAALGVELRIGTLFEAPSVAALAERLDSGSQMDALDVLLPLRSTGNHPPLFCVHPAGGLSWCYGGLVQHLSADYPIYGVQARGIARSEPLPATLAAMAQDYVDQLRTIQPNGPYYLLGWSLGGIVIHAMAERLQQQGQQVALLVMLDAYPADGLRLLPTPDHNEALEALLAMGGYDLRNLGTEPLHLETVVDLLRREGSPLATLHDATISALGDVYLNTAHILRQHVHSRCRADLLFFRATVETVDEALTPETWAPYIEGEIESHNIACTHKDMTQPGPIAEIGAILTARLQRHAATGEHPSAVVEPHV